MTRLQEKAAEEFLTEFPKRVEALWVCQQILGQSDNPELHQFQAVIALRQTAVQHWSSYGEDERSQLQSFVVQSILTRNAETEGVVMNALCGVAAILLKLRWQNTSVREEFLEVHGPL